MKLIPSITFARTRLTVASRRSVLAGLTGGLLATGIARFGEDEAEARKKGKRRKKRKNKNKNKNRKDRNRATVRVDATCPGSNQDGVGVNSGENRLAQTFTASRSGALVKAQLLISQDPGAAGDYVVRLSMVDGSGFPTNAVLAEATIANNEVPDGGGAIDFLFADPFSVVAGVEYALALSRPGGDKFLWMGESGSSCGGLSFFSAGQTEPFAPNAADFDHTFTTFVKS